MVRGSDGGLVRSIEGLRRGMALRIDLSDGEIQARVEGVSQDRPAQSSDPADPQGPQGGEGQASERRYRTMGERSPGQRAG